MNEAEYVESDKLPKKFRSKRIVYCTESREGQVDVVEADEPYQHIVKGCRYRERDLIICKTETDRGLNYLSTTFGDDVLRSLPCPRRYKIGNVIGALTWRNCDRDFVLGFGGGFRDR